MAAQPLLSMAASTNKFFNHYQFAPTLSDQWSKLPKQNKAYQRFSSKGQSQQGND